MLAFLGGTRPLKLSGGMARGAVGSGWDDASVNIPLGDRRSNTGHMTLCHIMYIHKAVYKLHAHSNTNMHSNCFWVTQGLLKIKNVEWPTKTNSLKTNNQLGTSAVLM